MPGTWTEADDRKLWSLHPNRTTTQLASTFGKTNGAIRARLKHLRDPDHKAFKRRVGSSGGGRGGGSTSAAPSAPSRSPYFSGSSASGASPSLVDLTTGASPFAAKYIAAKKKASPPSSEAKGAAASAPASQPRRRIDPSTLNADQRAASEYILSGGNAFLTGAAGVGKSYLLNYLIQGLRDKHEPGGSKQSDDPAVVVAAATGIAATHIQGVTIHSWSGVRLGVGGARVLVPRVLGNEAARRRWRNARVLVLDEVSMIDGMLFEALDAIGREARGCHSKPFGGIQLVLSGDFFQLPPVSLARCGFAFETPAWSRAAVRMVELRTVVRQLGDQTFIDLLNRIRIGICPADITVALEACHVSRKPLPADGIVPTKLYCTNRNVDEENNRKLRQLPEKEVLFAATDSFKGSYSRSVQKQLSETLDKKVPSELRLKVGAQVIITRNMPDRNLVNGSRGIVASFGECEGGEYQKGKYKNNAASRCTGNNRLYPIVHFSNGVKMTVQEESVFQGGSSGAMARSQLPLKLAWSLTVHKSQGMTIERAELQLDDAFDYGQVYVALSRITSLEGLWVRGGRITQGVVKAHPKVKDFYRRNGSTVFDEGRSAVGNTAAGAGIASEVICAPVNAPIAAAVSSGSPSNHNDDSDIYDQIFDA